MTEAPAAAIQQLAAIPNLRVQADEPLARHTRFGIGGPAKVFCDARDAASLRRRTKAMRLVAHPHVVIGGGTNLIVADAGFAGIVLRFAGKKHRAKWYAAFDAEAGAILQDVVDL